MGASLDLLHDIRSFSVGDLTKYSDHKPCCCIIKVKHEAFSPEDLLQCLQDAPVRHKWNNETNFTAKLYLEAQDDHDIKEKIASLQKSNCKTSEDVKNLNEELISTLTDIADKVIPKKGPSISKEKTQKKA